MILIILGNIILVSLIFGSILFLAGGNWVLALKFFGALFLLIGILVLGVFFLALGIEQVFG